MAIPLSVAEFTNEVVLTCRGFLGRIGGNAPGMSVGSLLDPVTLNVLPLPIITSLISLSTSGSIWKLDTEPFPK